MSDYRKKPVEVEAVRWTGDNLDEILALIPARDDGHFDLPDDDSGLVTPGIGYVPSQGTLDIPTLEGTMTAQLGDWIIRDVRGELYPCRDDIFRETYEPIDDPGITLHVDPSSMDSGDSVELRIRHIGGIYRPTPTTPHAPADSRPESGV